MTRTCVVISEARFLKASEEEFSKSFVNVSRRDLKVTVLLTSATVVDVGAEVVVALVEETGLAVKIILKESVTEDDTL